MVLRRKFSRVDRIGQLEERARIARLEEELAYREALERAELRFAQVPAFEVQGAGNFQRVDSNDDAEDLVVLDFRILRSAAQRKGQDYRLNIEVSFAGTEQIESEKVEISDVGLFRPAESAKLVGVYEPLSSTDVPDSSLKVAQKRTSLSAIDLAVDIRAVPIADKLHFSAAILVKGRSRDAGLRWKLKTDLKFTVANAARQIPRAGTNEYDDILQFKGNGYHTPLSWAAASGWVEYLRQRDWTDLDRQGKDGRTPLSWAAGNGQEQATEMLLDVRGININEADKEGRVPLSWAAGNGFKKTVEMLLEKEEIEPDQADKKGQTPLFWAAQNDAPDAVVSLLTFGSSSTETTAQRHGTRVKVDFDVIDENGETPLSIAAHNKHDEVMELLVEEGLKQHPQPDDEVHGTLSWASSYLHKAAERGWLGLVKLLIRKNLKVDSLHGDASHGVRTPLCTAAEEGHARIVDALLEADADRNFQTDKCRDTPLLFAVRGGRDDVVRVLLEYGADISRENVRQERPIDLAINGSLPNHHTILQMLAQREKDGPLAKIAAKKYQNVDHEFKATVIDFFDTVDQDQIDARAFFVDELLENPRLEHDHSKGNLSFRWLHLPANNMMWVEVLVARLFDNPAEAYRVLDSERWVGRQHRGGFGAHQNHHARFMRPLCRTFRGISESLFEGDTPRSDDISSKECLVLFMPYLHWDTVDQQEKREHIMNQPLREQQLREERHPENERPEQEPPEHIVPLPNKDQRLTAAYLLEAHPLHVRRTLDQYYYHSMLDTKRRDIDQVVSRYQKDQNLNPKVISMVDQLWLWVLPGAGDQVDTVITSFPSREHVSSTLGVEDPDPYDFTDVLRSIKMQLLAERSSVRTACDLAGIIASQCSKAYLDIGTMNERPGFSEIYEIAISDVMRKEADLFENFNILTKASDEEVALSSDLVDMLASDPIARDALPLASLVELCERYRNNPFHGPLTASNITNWFSLPATNQRAAAMHLITKIGRIQVLDISREISLLREVKDIQDELSIMSVLFDDQKKVLTTLESVIRSKAAPKSSLKALQRRKVHSERELGEVRNAFSAFDMRPVQITSTNQAQDNFLEKRKMVHFPIEEENEASSSTKRRSSPPPTPPELPNESPTQRVDGWVETGKATKDFSDSDRFLELNAGHQGTINIGSIITDNRASETFGEGDARKPTSPLAVVQVCIDEIGRMFQRARKANQALDFLVDLKQTQSNVLDSRSARIQAEESLKMTEQSVTMTREMVNLTGQTAETNAQIVTLTQETVKMNEENKKQGKTLMVFTIVTIIFLPLSFMAAFFAINIGAFHRDDKGFLGLGYVSEIMFPISAMITGALIYVAFRVERLEDIRIWMKKLIKRRKRVSGVVVGGVVGGATGGGGAVVGASGGSAV